MSYSEPPPPPPPYGAPVPPYGGGEPPYGYGYGGGVPQDHPRATTILVLGIVSIVCCGLLTGIPAIVMGRSAMAEIDASQGRLGGRGNVKAGFICGIIGTALSVLGILFYVVLFAAAVGSGS